MKISVIGAGIGGLAAACRLAREGHQVTIFEKNEQVGGKMNIYREGGYRFDTGPSLLTMPFVLEDLFRYCGESLDEYLTLLPLEPITRYFYPDGTKLDLFSDLSKTLAELDRIAPEDRETYTKFLGHTADLYEKTAPVFLFEPLSRLSDVLKADLTDFLKINPFEKVSASVDRRFDSPYLRQIFKRFTTYNGSSPYQAPATLNVIAYVELCLGGFYVDGGIYRIAEALAALAEKLGVTIQYKTGIDKILVSDGKANGIRTEFDEEIASDLVVANSDSTDTYLNLISGQHLPSRVTRKMKKIEPSCSGFVILAGSNRRYEQLAHHNIFFTSNYRREFEQIFKEKVMPDDPTIYIADTSHTNPEHAPDGGSNLFILVNAPYLSDAVDWENEKEGQADRILSTLESNGLKSLTESLKVKKLITPQDFYRKYRSNRGSIYGTSSNSLFSAFVRPRNKSPYINNLYLVGGSTHPGGGIPLALLSAEHACALVEE